MATGAASWDTTAFEALAGLWQLERHHIDMPVTSDLFQISGKEPTVTTEDCRSSDEQTPLEESCRHLRLRAT
jgi:hypothetical protein